jgi:hypothetical protein
MNEHKYELLSNFDIIELADLMGINLIDVVSKDKLLSLPVTNGGYVINLDNLDGQGTHWVALWIENNDAVYFDSFGSPPPLSVIKFCKRKNFIESDYIIQNINQVACGYYCLAFLHYFTFNKHKNNRYKLNLFIKPYDLENSHQNDNILQEYLKTVKI